jgi:uncharacterized protein Yka (UPF0111/DUF47 family)
MKSRIIDQLGEHEILLPALIAEGLAANDRIKVRLSVMQAAASHARDGARFNLGDECRAAGIDPVTMETLVNRASLLSDDQVSTPGLDELGRAIWDDMTTMIRSVSAGDEAQGAMALARLKEIKGAVAAGPSDEIALLQISKLTSLATSGGDSLHRLVMDLHKALNRLSVSHAKAVLAGAHVHSLLPKDRAPIEAFMRGVNATRKLKFGHPGLATAATHAGDRLTIENDLGETDAHVVVIAVEENAVTVTYTDVHLSRARFFTDLLRNFPIQWSGIDRKAARGLADEGEFYLLTGKYSGRSGRQRDAFLEALGASLVFIIDWNKARKLLRTWIRSRDAVRVLDWAARNGFGHRAFLELGGSQLVGSAVHHVAAGRIGFGERLDRTLGREGAIDLLQTVLRVCAEGLLQGASARLTRDRIEADLARRLQRVDGMLLATVVRQAGLAREIAVGIARFIFDLQAQRRPETVTLAARARRIEEKGDRIATEAMGEIKRLDVDPDIRSVVNSAEQAINELEQAAFIASLVPTELPDDLLEPLAELGHAAVTGTEAVAICASAAADVPEGQSIDSEVALRATDQLIDVEHRADAGERVVTAIVLRGDFNLRTALSILDLARALEQATDRLLALGRTLGTYVVAHSSG